MRVLAEGSHDLETKRLLIELAVAYEGLTDRAELELRDALDKSAGNQHLWRKKPGLDRNDGVGSRLRLELVAPFGGLDQASILLAQGYSVTLGRSSIGVDLVG